MLLKRWCIFFKLSCQKVGFFSSSRFRDGACSRSHSGGNLVDGLPQAQIWGVKVALMDMSGFRLVVSVYSNVQFIC